MSAVFVQAAEGTAVAAILPTGPLGAQTAGNENLVFVSGFNVFADLPTPLVTDLNLNLYALLDQIEFDDGTNFLHLWIFEKQGIAGSGIGNIVTATFGVAPNRSCNIRALEYSGFTPGAHDTALGTGNGFNSTTSALSVGNNSTLVAHRNGRNQTGNPTDGVAPPWTVRLPNGGFTFWSTEEWVATPAGSYPAGVVGGAFPDQWTMAMVNLNTAPAIPARNAPYFNMP